MQRQIVKIVIPDFIPPSVNHYKKPIKLYTKQGVRTAMGLTAEAQAFIQLTAFCARGQTLIPPGATRGELDRIRYTLHARVIFGKGQRGDGDNFWKCIADSLAKAGVIHSDARVKRWYIEVVDDERADGPRTEIRVALMRSKACMKSPKTKPPKPFRACSTPATTSLSPQAPA